MDKVIRRHGGEPLARSLILLGTVALAAVLAFLTVAFATQYGFGPHVILALLMLGVIVFGAIGALTSKDDEG